MENIKRGDIYYADLSPIIGSEQGGLRPVLCIQNDEGNQHSPTTIVAALTSRRTKHWIPTHVRLHSDNLLKKSTVLLEQIRTLDKTRLMEYVGTVSESDMAKIDRAIKISMGVAKRRKHRE